jgi:hypothetical protein
LDNVISTGVPASSSPTSSAGASDDDGPHGLGDSVVIILIVVFVAIGILLLSCIGLYIYRSQRRKRRGNSHEAGIAPNSATQNFRLSGLSLVSVEPSIRSEQLPSYREAVAAGRKADEEGVVDAGLLR